MRIVSLAIAGAMLAGTAAADATLIRDYRLDGSYADALGNAAISPLGDVTLGSTGVSFDAGEGLQLGLTLSTYSIESAFRFNNVDGYRRIYDFLARGSDSGLYVLNGSTNFYPLTGGGNAFAPQTDVRVVFTRDDATDLAVAYVNGVQQISFTDSTDLANIATMLTFFADNSGGGPNGEHSGGFVDYIRIYDTALTATQVADLTPPSSGGGAVPEPASWALMILGFGLTGAAMRRRRAIAIA